MCAVYAFMRYSDDVSDEAAVTDRRFSGCSNREALDRAFQGDYGDSLILPAFHDTVLRYAIPTQYFHELIDGCEIDLTRTRWRRSRPPRLLLSRRERRRVRLYPYLGLQQG